MRADQRLISCHLAACIAGVFAVQPLSAGAATVMVTSCADDLSGGTLRTVIGSAPSDAVIDVHTQLPLACSTISLQHGEIPIIATNLTIEGPDDRTLDIDAGNNSRIFHHSGSGKLSISYLTLRNGKYGTSSGNAQGGCIMSEGSVYLTESMVTGCAVGTKNQPAKAYAAGGGIYANFVKLDHSDVVGNMARAYYNSEAIGGGVSARLGTNAVASTISFNSAIAVGASASSIAGGLFSVAGMTVTNSTLDNNQANLGGAIYQKGFPGSTVTLINSTISSNNARTGAAMDIGTTLVLYSSTVVFNAATSSFSGILAHGNVQAYSSIIAKNAATGNPFDDLAITGASSALAGAGNLIQSSNKTLPLTLTDDPQLAPLAFHGGPTRTHAPLATSPVVDAGINPKPLPTDQRGTGFGRENPSGKPDIGAYERQVNDDELFANGLEQ